MKAEFYISLARNSSVWLSKTSLITIGDAKFQGPGIKTLIPPETTQVPIQLF